MKKGKGHFLYFNKEPPCLSHIGNTIGELVIVFLVLLEMNDRVLPLVTKVNKAKTFTFG